MRIKIDDSTYKPSASAIVQPVPVFIFIIPLAVRFANTVHRSKNRGAGGPVPPNILGGGPGPPNSYTATLSQSYAMQ